MISDPFLKEVADILLKPGRYDLARTCVVFPNKRARLYLSKYIGELTQKPVWAPAYFTISELMERLSGYFIADRIQLIFSLYKAFRETTYEKESFESFYAYSEMLLADFDEIDKYLINADDLFINLSGLKTIDGRFSYLSEEQIKLIQRFWKTFNPEAVSESQTQFISLWEKLPAIYHTFKNRLSAMGIAYEGMAYREASIDPAKIITLLPYRKYVIAGFNALNPCEEKLFRVLKNNHFAEFYWDYDEWYINSDIHEAGTFIRKNIKSFPEEQILNHEFLRKPKKIIAALPVPSNTGQASVLSNCFSMIDNHESSNMDKTAVVLADENLLMPVLYSIPDEITSVNVTMGYPLAGSAIYSLIDSLFELTRNAKKSEEGKVLWHFRDILNIMNNPLLTSYYAGQIDKIRSEAFDRHKVYFLSEETIGSEDVIFNPALLTGSIPDYLLETFSNLFRLLKSKEKTDEILVELLFKTYTFLSRLSELVKEHQIDSTPETVFRLILRMLRGMRIPFSGEPLTGLQVLGVLETRTLDFENIIVLSANEGILPKSNDNTSFIPQNLRAGFGMPTSDHYDAMYSYYFYRMLQRADSVFLVYNNSQGGLLTGERSRYLHQLIYEMQLPVKELILETTVKQIPSKAIIVPKDEVVASALRKYAFGQGKMLSPSAINEFMNCSLRFYFHYIEGLRPLQETEEIDYRMFGNILHNALRRIFTGLADALISREKLEALLKKEDYLNTILQEAIREEFSQDNNQGAIEHLGFNLIVQQIILIYIRQFIKTEAEACPFTIVSLEKEHSMPFETMLNKDPLLVKIGGYIDRIDKREGVTRILDYKTGTPKGHFESIESLFMVDESRNDAVFQVLLYAYIYMKQNPGETIAPGLLFLRQSYSDSFSSGITMGKEILTDFSKVAENFENYLKTTLQRLFNTQEPFVQTTNLEICKKCNYNLICRRENS